MGPIISELLGAGLIKILRIVIKQIKPKKL